MRRAFTRPSGTIGNRLDLLTQLFRARPADPLETTDRPADAFDAVWRANAKSRVLIVLSVIMLWCVGVEARLVMLQVVDHDEYKSRAATQQITTVEELPLRGDLVDRHGALLAYSTDAHRIMGFPLQAKDASQTVGLLCDALTDCTAAERDEWLTRFAGKKAFTMRFARSLTEPQADRVAAAKIDGIVLEDQSLRSYPMGSLASHVLGFVGIDNIGLAGLEHTYDRLIQGQPGKLLVEWDAKHNWIETRMEQKSVAGATLELTIDAQLQHVVERELAAGVELNKAQGGAAVVMDPNSGEILAMASYPDFDPNRYGQSAPDDRKNRATQDVYEPGSTFKMVTASAAIQEGVIQTTDMIDTAPGCIKIGSRPPICDASHENWGTISFEDVIVHSSNVGAIKVGLRVGADRLSQYVRRFGFGQILSPDFPGQSGGVVWALDKINDSALASMSMGYQVDVTPLQMATAASAVANGGTLYAPRVVRAVIRDGVRQTVPMKPVHQAITPETAATLTSIMEDVVLRGTGRQAQLDHYQVAGKTGTAAKLVDHQYSKTDYNASFVGFVPSRRPVYTILVVVDTPKAGHTYGGDVAAPIFKKIAEAALARNGVPPTINPTPPIFTNSSATTLASLNSVTPPPMPTLTMLGGQPVMPDLRGLSARDATRVLAALGMTTRLNGDGFVVAQSPDPGATVGAGQLGLLDLRRRPDDHTAGGRQR
jgi:cell division protein FtsI (penicillin-binding protein 3)